jgi:TraM recognition site of TraD and TraG
MWPFTHKKNPRVEVVRTSDRWKPCAKVLDWSKKDSLSLESAYQNLFICGAPGSSKTTASGAAFAEGLLRLGCGGLVLTAKPDEIPRWLKYCRQAGRSRDVAVFGPGEGFNFIDYERTRDGKGAGFTQNIVDLIEVACEIGDRSQAQRGSGLDEGRFWRDARRQLCASAVVVLSLGHGRVRPTELYDLVLSAPRSLIEKDSAQWRAESFCAQSLLQAEERCGTSDERADLELAARYLLCEFPALSDKTRSNVISTLSAMIDVLLRTPARNMLCGETTITPEFAQNGGIIIMGCPLLEHGFAGSMIQGIFKYSFQRALVRRDVAVSRRPVFIFADEFQCFLNSFDQEFFATCRSFRALNVCLTQNIPNLYAALGGEQRGKAQVDSILGNMNLKVMHANGDPVTNQWASTSIGTSKQYVFSANTTHNGADWWTGTGYSPPQISAGMTESYELDVQPAEFTRLKAGGRRNRWQADAIVFQSGQLFADTGKTWRRATFRQKF